MVAYMKSEDNQHSIVLDEDEQRAANMDLGGPSGEFSTTATVIKDKNQYQNPQIAMTNYMQGSIADMN